MIQLEKFTCVTDNVMYLPVLEWLDKDALRPPRCESRVWCEIYLYIYRGSTNLQFVPPSIPTGHGIPDVPMETCRNAQEGTGCRKLQDIWVSTDMIDLLILI